MKFGYFTLTDNSPGYGASRRDPNQLLLEVAEECVEAEAMGYQSAWVPEHHFGRFGILPSPAIFLTHVAARTRTLKLGPATVVLPLNHPLRVVEEFNLLDVLSNGRAVFSAGRGYDAGGDGPLGAAVPGSRAAVDGQMGKNMTAGGAGAVAVHGQEISPPRARADLPP